MNYDYANMKYSQNYAWETPAFLRDATRHLASPHALVLNHIQMSDNRKQEKDFKLEVDALLKDTDALVKVRLAACI